MAAKKLDLPAPKTRCGVVREVSEEEGAPSLPLSSDSPAQPQSQTRTRQALSYVPLRPMMTLCLGEKGSVSDWCRKERKPDRTTCLMCMAGWARWLHLPSLLPALLCSLGWDKGCCCRRAWLAGCSAAHSGRTTRPWLAGSCVRVVACVG